MNELKVDPIEGFDCMAFKRKAQDQIYKATNDMSPQQYVKYIHRKAREGKMGKLLEWLKKTVSFVGTEETGSF